MNEVPYIVRTGAIKNSVVIRGIGGLKEKYVSVDPPKSSQKFIRLLGEKGQ